MFSEHQRRLGSPQLGYTNGQSKKAHIRAAATAAAYCYNFKPGPRGSPVTASWDHRATSHQRAHSFYSAFTGSLFGI